MAEKGATPEPKCRWYQFRIRTLLIAVALLAIPLSYVGWQAKIVQERKAMVETIRKRGGALYPFASVELFGDGPALWCRKLLGDPGFGLIGLPEAMEEQSDAVRKLFPESTVGAMPHGLIPGTILLPSR